MPRKTSGSQLEDVRAANDIVNVVSSYFNLQQRGSTFKALCPFHKEKTPSFIVNQQRQIFHCFGCGAGGDVFRFIMDYEKVDFPTAVRMLAQRAGITLSFERDERGRKPGKDALYELLGKVALLYNHVLRKEKTAGAARRYLRSRGIEGKAAAEFTLGFAPDQWDFVLRWAEKKYSYEQLEAVGLVIASARADPAPRVGSSESAAKTGRRYDRFRNRIVFPVHDELGRVVGFSARALPDAEGGAKYVNTPETAIFHKGRVLYGLHNARRNIADAREAIVCEGQLDVIKCHLAGFKTAVAPQGTAFTEEHAHILRRYADSAVLVFDADQAGRDAALRAAHTLLHAGMTARIARLPSGEDPDSLLGGPDGTEVFRSVLKKAQSALDFLMDLLAEREDIGTEAGLLRTVSAVFEMIGKTPNAVQQEMLLRHASKRLGVSEESLFREFRKKIARVRPVPDHDAPPASDDGSGPPAREIALAEHLVAEPSLAGLAEEYLPLDHLTDESCRQVVQAAILAAEQGEDVMKIISSKDADDRRLSRLAARMLAAGAKAKGGLATNEDCVKSLILGIRTDMLKRRRKELERAQLEADRDKNLSPARMKAIQMEYYQLEYDIAHLKKWETAVPLMENM